MSKWKCEICGLEFENFHAQGFNHKIYCPLCYYKELYKQNKVEIQRLTAESTEWESKCYRYQDILNELENLITLKIIRATNEEDYDIELDDMKELLNELKRLKSGDKE